MYCMLYIDHPIYRNTRTKKTRMKNTFWHMQANKNQTYALVTSQQCSLVSPKAKIKHSTVPWAAAGPDTLHQGCPGWAVRKGSVEHWGLVRWSGSGFGAWRSGSELHSDPTGRDAAEKWHPAGCSLSHLGPLTLIAGPSGCRSPSVRWWFIHTWNIIKYICQ